MADHVSALVQRMHEERAKALAHLELLNKAVGADGAAFDADLDAYRKTLEARVADADKLLAKWEPLLRDGGRMG